MARNRYEITIFHKAVTIRDILSLKGGLAVIGALTVIGNFTLTGDMVSTGSIGAGTFLSVVDGIKWGSTLILDYDLIHQTIALGEGAGLNHNSDGSIYIGINAGKAGADDGQIFIGEGAGQNSGADTTIAIGKFAGDATDSDNSVFIGTEAGKDTSSNNIFVLKMNNIQIIPLIQGNFLTKIVVIQKLNIADIPTSSGGLSSGDVWSNSGILTIVS